MLTLLSQKKNLAQKQDYGTWGFRYSYSKYFSNNLGTEALVIFKKVKMLNLFLTRV